VELNLYGLLLAKDEEGETALHMAARGSHVEILQNLCVWAEDVQLCPNYLKNKLLLAKITMDASRSTEQQKK
jgi:ankyrin repeat protein